MKRNIIIFFVFLITQLLYSEPYIGVWGAVGNLNYKSGDRSYLIVSEVGDRYLVILNRLYDQGNKQWGGFSGFSGIGKEGIDFDGNQGLIIDVDNSSSSYFLRFGDWGDYKDILILNYAQSQANTPDGNLGMFSSLEYGELNAFGVLNSDNVNFRSIPSLDGHKEGQLSSGDQIRLIERTSEKMRIGSMNDFWYKFYSLENNAHGWIYGHFIDIEFEKLKRDKSPGYSYMKTLE